MTTHSPKISIAPPAGDTISLPEKPVSRMPLAIGKPLKIKKMSPAEERKLIEIGWTPGDPVPDNLPELLEQVQQIQKDATDPNSLPPPVPMDTPPLDYDASQEIDISKLPPEKQAEYKKLLNQVWSQTKEKMQHEDSVESVIPPGAGEGVAETIRRAMSAESDIEIEDDSEVQQDDNATITDGAKTEGKTCPRCSFPLDEEDTVKVTDEDRDLYIATIGALQPFTKTFHFINDTLGITVRELSSAETELVWQQVVVDHKLKRIASMDDARDMRLKYNIALQVIDITAKERQVNYPASLKQWKEEELPKSEAEEDMIVRAVYLHTREEDWPESIYRLLASTVIEFDLLKNKLEANSRTPDFWKPHTDA